MQGKKIFYFKSTLVPAQKTCLYIFTLVQEKATTRCKVVMKSYCFYIVTTATLSMPKILITQNK